MVINQGTGAGGSKTNSTGLKFEDRVSLVRLLGMQNGYRLFPKELDLTVVNSRWDIKFEDNIIGEIFKQNGLERFLRENGIVMSPGKKGNLNAVLSKGFKPDEALYLIQKDFVHIVEDKTQNGPGSVDEKLQTAPYKKVQYDKLFKLLNRKTKFTYILDSQYFKQPAYKDTLEYIDSLDFCNYIFDTEILSVFPFEKFDLPIPKGDKNAKF